MEVHCPRCQGKIIVEGVPSPDEIRCGECGSTFIRPGETVSFIPDGTEHEITYVPAQQHSASDGLPKLGDYEVIEEIARGGMGVVYRAHQRSLNRTVALKMIRADRLEDPEDIARFRAEAEAAAQLDHPGIVPVYEVGEHDGQHFLSMAFVGGGCLKDQLAEGPISPTKAAESVKLMAEAVQYAHDRGVIHRDIKPRNILLDEQGQPRITDFGLAKNLLSESELTVTGEVMGTPPYMSPEQASGDETGPLSDVYSLGATLYCLLTGRPPFQASTPLETIQQVIERDPVAPRALNRVVPKDLETICMKCLWKEPKRRYNSAREFAEDLSRWLDGEPIHARPVARLERVWMWCKRRPSLVGISLAAVAILVIVSTVLVERKNDAEATRLVDGLLAADTSQVSTIIDDLDGYQTWAKDDLASAFESPPDEFPNAKLHAALALLPEHEPALEYIRDRLLTVSPVQFGPVRELLYAHESSLIEDFWPDLLEHFWTLATDEGNAPAVRFQAACALASYDPENASWANEELTRFIAEHLMGVQPSVLLPWQNALKPVKQHLTGPMMAIYHNEGVGNEFAADVLSNYLSDDPEELFGLLAEANKTQFPVIFEKLAVHRERAIELGRAEIAVRSAEDASADQRETLALRQANAAIMLLRMDASDHVWPLLRHSPDPRVRTYIIHWLSPLRADPAAIIASYEQQSDDSVKQALLLCLGEFPEAVFTENERESILEILLSVYRADPDAGLHSAAEWLLRQWGYAEQLVSIEQELWQDDEQLRADPDNQREWYVNSQSQTFVVLDAGEFRMGSPDSEVGRFTDEELHRRRIGRRVAISTKEVTKAQWREFDAFALVWSPDQDGLQPYIRTDDSPIVGVTWYEAAWYCNWLSEQVGIPEEEWCYLPNDEGEYGPGMRAKEGFLQRTGYRLPTESEWEFACRAGTETSRFYGESDTLLPNYAWYLTNADERAWPVASLKPNNFGMFDMQGNVWEWCYDVYQDYPSSPMEVVLDEPGTEPVTNDLGRVLRGMSFNNDGINNARSAYRYGVSPDNRPYGFRVARTMP